MRIRRLDLDLFGHFSGRSFDFGPVGDSPDASDFHVIYGPNEAGKTTTMEGFLRLLYGFPTRDPYDFLHQRKNLSVSGVLETEAGPRRFTRLSPRSASLLDDSGAALPESAISALLGGLSQEDYRNLLCLDDDTIEQGGQEIANARGDIGRLLFSAAAGIADLSGVLDAARARADALYRKRASSTTMAGLKKDLAEVERRIREQDVSASAWGKLKHALKTAHDAETQVRADRDAMRRQEAEVRAHRAALPRMVEIDALAEAIAPHAAYPQHLDIDPERLVAMQVNRARATHDAERLGGELDALRGQLSETVLRPGDLQLGAALDALADLHSRQTTADLDLGKRRAALADIVQDMDRAARDLGVAEGTDPQRLVLPEAQIAALEAGREAARASRRARDMVATDLDSLARDLSDAEARLKALHPEARDAAQAGIIDLLRRFDVDGLAPAVAAARQAIDAAQDRAEAAMGVLLPGSPPGSPPDSALPGCPVTEAAAQDLAERHADLSAQVAQAEQTHAQHLREAAVLTAQIDRMATTGGVVGDAGVAALRTDRDTLWTAHRKALTGATADAFEAAMARLDHSAEARLAHARDLGELRQLEGALTGETTRAAHAEARLADLTARLTALGTAISEAAHGCALPPGTAAPALLAWVRRHAAATEAVHTLALLRARHAPVLDKADRLTDALRPLIDLDAPDFGTAVATARALAEAERNHIGAQDLARQAVRDCKAALTRKRATLADLGDAADGADAAWAMLVAEAFHGLVPAETLEASLEPLHRLRGHDLQRIAAARQVAGMEADQASFAAHMEAMAAEAGLPADAPLTPIDIYATLRVRAAAARAAQDNHDALTREIAQKTRALQTAEASQADIDREARDLGALFPPEVPTDTIDALRKAVATTQETIKARRAKAALEVDMLAALSLPDMEATRGVLAGLQAAELDAQATTLETDLAAIEARLTATTEARVAAERDLAAVTGSADIAQLVERRTTLELEIEDTALSYLEWTLGHRLAEEAIRRYRDAHRSGMMAATETAFAALTNGGYRQLRTQPEGGADILVAIDADGTAKQAADMSKGTRFQLYLALRAAAYGQLADQGIRLPFFCDDIFETFDEARTRAACGLMDRIGRQGQAIYLTHHRHVVEIAREVCGDAVQVHDIT